jgi:hypothetical protein
VKDCRISRTVRHLGAHDFPLLSWQSACATTLACKNKNNRVATARPRSWLRCRSPTGLLLRLSGAAPYHRHAFLLGRALSHSLPRGLRSRWCSCANSSQPADDAPAALSTSTQLILSASDSLCWRCCHAQQSQRSNSAGHPVCANSFQLTRRWISWQQPSGSAYTGQGSIRLGDVNPAWRCDAPFFDEAPGIHSSLSSLLSPLSSGNRRPESVHPVLPARPGTLYYTCILASCPQIAMIDILASCPQFW